MRRFLALAFIFICPTVFASDLDYLYKATMIRAAPGHLIDLISLVQARMATMPEQGDDAPFWIRHSQGDQWDLMLLFPLESYRSFYQDDRITKRRQKDEDGAEFRKKCGEWIAWQEDIWVYGPDIDQVRGAFAETAYFHVEIFRALPGKHAELLEQRRMENVYLGNINRPKNLIFVRDQGAGWDLFTIGFYRDIKHFAESADVALEDEEKAAKTAGFEAANRIGTYLRTLIAEHHDTLAVAIPRQ